LRWKTRGWAPAVPLLAKDRRALNGEGVSQYEARTSGVGQRPLSSPLTRSLPRAFRKHERSTPRPPPILRFSRAAVVVTTGGCACRIAPVTCICPCMHHAPALTGLNTSRTASREVRAHKDRSRIPRFFAIWTPSLSLSRAISLPCSHATLPPRYLPLRICDRARANPAIARNHDYEPTSRPRKPAVYFHTLYLCVQPGRGASRNAVKARCADTARGNTQFH
jgi:hypothetical protein